MHYHFNSSNMNASNAASLSPTITEANPAMGSYAHRSTTLDSVVKWWT